MRQWSRIAFSRFRWRQTVYISGGEGVDDFLGEGVGFGVLSGTNDTKDLTNSRKEIGQVIGVDREGCDLPLVLAAVPSIGGLVVRAQAC